MQMQICLLARPTGPKAAVHFRTKALWGQRLRYCWKSQFIILNGFNPNLNKKMDYVWRGRGAFILQLRGSLSAVLDDGRTI